MTQRGPGLFSVAPQRVRGYNEKKVTFRPVVEKLSGDKMVAHVSGLQPHTSA